MPDCTRIRYHEEQRAQECARHAINNLLGARRSTCNNMARIADQLSEEFGIDRSELVGEGGYYDVSVITRFLLDRGYEVHQLAPQDFIKMSRRQSKRLIGYILGDGHHWKCMKKTGRLDCYFVLDSINKEKEHIKNVGEYMYDNDFQICIKVLKSK
jgi:hypothetical protein